MPRVKIKHNLRGYAAIRSAPGVRADLEARGKRIAAQSNQEARTEDFKVSSQQGRGRAPRWRVTVITAGYHAIRHNAAHNTLIKKMGRG